MGTGSDTFQKKSKSAGDVKDEIKRCRWKEGSDVGGILTL